MPGRNGRVWRFMRDWRRTDGYFQTRDRFRSLMGFLLAGALGHRQIKLLNWFDACSDCMLDPPPKTAILGGADGAVDIAESRGEWVRVFRDDRGPEPHLTTYVIVFGLPAVERHCLALPREPAEGSRPRLPRAPL
jgi:hypothetical protein